MNPVEPRTDLLRSVGWDVSDQHSFISFLLCCAGCPADVQRYAIDREHPDQRVLFHSTRQRPSQFERAEVDEFPDECCLRGSRAGADAEGFVDIRCLLVRALRRVVKKLAEPIQRTTAQAHVFELPLSIAPGLSSSSLSTNLRQAAAYSSVSCARQYPSISASTAAVPLSAFGFFKAIWPPISPSISRPAAQALRSSAAKLRFHPHSWRVENPLSNPRENRGRMRSESGSLNRRK